MVRCPVLPVFFFVLVLIILLLMCLLYVSSVHRSSGGGGAVVLTSTALPTPDQPPGCQRYGGVVHESSDEAEAELTEELERTSCCYPSHHPRPISVKSFMNFNTCHLILLRDSVVYYVVDKAVGHEYSVILSKQCAEVTTE